MPLSSSASIEASKSSKAFLSPGTKLTLTWAALSSSISAISSAIAVGFENELHPFVQLRLLPSSSAEQPQSSGRHVCALQEADAEIPVQFLREPRGPVLGPSEHDMERRRRRNEGG